MTANRAFVIQARDAEILAGDGSRLWLLADASDCCGALGANRLRLEAGAAGAKRHLHKKSSEAFYVLEGTLEMDIEGETVRIDEGGYAVVPPGVVHAFRAAAGKTADVLVTLVPGVDRFGYFRSLPSILRGELDERALAEMQERYDVHFA
ncbi:cupin domain-containing protein [Luteimonas gilva]|uniref:Cupin domain-containing protein n=1 Tax=Luteimonas gilva TaxID=2572684 RepID=A0A4U5JW09_9GAMM|nr:cupin domain-containing protein [Luteimonas gilva]TKR34150.1 cupin domain-containing protein [Luteimonas gilva]